MQYQFRFNEEEYVRLSAALLLARQQRDDSATHAIVHEFLQYLPDDLEDAGEIEEEPDAEELSAAIATEDAAPPAKPRLGIFRKPSA
jgi:hypothetical protein